MEEPRLFDTKKSVFYKGMKYFFKETLFSAKKNKLTTCALNIS